jgi:hypothetical protein
VVFDGFLGLDMDGNFHNSFEIATIIAIFAPLSGVVVNPCILGK